MEWLKDKLFQNGISRDTWPQIINHYNKLPIVNIGKAKQNVIAQ